MERQRRAVQAAAFPLARGDRYPAHGRAGDGADAARPLGGPCGGRRVDRLPRRPRLGRPRGGHTQRARPGDDAAVSHRGGRRPGRHDAHRGGHRRAGGARAGATRPAWRAAGARGMPRARDAREGTRRPGSRRPHGARIRHMRAAVPAGARSRAAAARSRLPRARRRLVRPRLRAPGHGFRRQAGAVGERRGVARRDAVPLPLAALLRGTTRGGGTALDIADTVGRGPRVAGRRAAPLRAGVGRDGVAVFLARTTQAPSRSSSAGGWPMWSARRRAPAG